jgi:hypothetical protein
MGKIDGETFLGRLLIFFFGGAGEGRRNSRARNVETMRRCFTGQCEFRTFLCVCIYNMLGSGSFAATCLQAIAKGVLDPRLPWSDTFVVRLRQPVDLVHTSKSVKGLLLLVPSRTPRSSGHDFYTHAVYVVMCYMSITCTCLLCVVIYYMSVKCYVSVMCLVLAASCICICPFYVVICCMSLICYMSVIRLV